VRFASAALNAALIDGSEHLLRVRLDDGKLTVSLDDSDVLGPVVLPNYVPFTGYFGFGVGTGSAFEDDVLTRVVSVRIGTSGPCAAPLNGAIAPPG
jgi:hypothetical protein